MPRHNRPPSSGRGSRSSKSGGSAGSAARRAGSGPNSGSGISDDDDLRQLFLGNTTSRQSRGGDTWIVRQISAANATKPYLCPGCNQNIAIGTAHVVAWRDESVVGAFGGVEDRRHWHSGCWRSGRRA